MRPILINFQSLEYTQCFFSYKEQIFEKIYKKLRKNLYLLHCVTDYPVDDKYANLKCIENLSRQLKINVGYSDHTIGNEAALAAIAMGARVVEKHFTIRNDYSSFRDHQLSANPDAANQ